MTSDLVKQLETVDPEDNPAKVRELMLSAADEIERLQNELKKLNKAIENR